MKRMVLVLAAALSAMGVAQARAQEVPPEVVNAVQALVSDGWLPYDPTDPENSGPPPPQATAAEVHKWRRTGLLKKIDITPGKAPDWLIDTEKTEYPAAWCGTGGCLVEIWSSGEDGTYVKTLRSQLRMYKVHRLPGKDYGWLEVDYHGSHCGLTGVEACPWGYEWRDDGLGKFALRASWRFTKKDFLRTGPVPQAIDTVLDDAPDAPPPPIAALITANEAACDARHATADQSGLINRTPDLNGDGIDDWSYYGQWMDCHVSEPVAVDDAPADATDPIDYCGEVDCGIRVWISRRQGDAVAWQAIDLNPERQFGIIYHVAAPVQLVELRDAEGVEPDSEQSCATYFISQCVLAPISLSPKP